MNKFIILFLFLFSSFVYCVEGPIALTHKNAGIWHGSFTVPKDVVVTQWKVVITGKNGKSVEINSSSLENSLAHRAQSDQFLDQQQNTWYNFDKYIGGNGRSITLYSDEANAIDVSLDQWGEGYEDLIVEVYYK